MDFEDLLKPGVAMLVVRGENKYIMMSLLSPVFSLAKVLISVHHRRRALSEGNSHKNMLLHQVVFCEQVMMVDAVLEYKIEKKLKRDGNENLLELRNDLDETLVNRAAKYR